MNKKVLVIFALTIIALIFLTLITFGPLSFKTKRGANPASLNPISSSKGKNTDQAINSAIDFNTYRNIDVKENYYKVSIPKEWQVKAGDVPGKYTINFSEVSGNIRLMDVPDNSTLELFLLSQEEPKLKRTIANYQRLDFQKTMIDSNEAYILKYSADADNKKSEIISAYIAGQDNAVVISFGASIERFQASQPIFDKIIYSFKWQNK
jgi:hypothetical protein